MLPCLDHGLYRHAIDLIHSIVLPLFSPKLVVTMDPEDIAVSPLTILEEVGDACDRRRARLRHGRDLPVAHTFAKQLRDLQALAECLEFAEARDVTEEIRHLHLALPRYESIDERHHPRLPAPTIFGKASLHGYDSTMHYDSVAM